MARAEEEIRLTQEKMALESHGRRLQAEVEEERYRAQTATAAAVAASPARSDSAFSTASTDYGDGDDSFTADDTTNGGGGGAAAGGAAGSVASLQQLAQAKVAELAAQSEELKASLAAQSEELREGRQRVEVAAARQADCAVRAEKVRSFPYLPHCHVMLPLTAPEQTPKPERRRSRCCRCTAKKRSRTRSRTRRSRTKNRLPSRASR